MDNLPYLAVINVLAAIGLCGVGIGILQIPERVARWILAVYVPFTILHFL